MPPGSPCWIATSSSSSTTAACPAGCSPCPAMADWPTSPTYGQRDMEADLPVETDTIWRLFSMTKPITAVAAMILWERGGFELNDPVRSFIPSFGDLRVWRGGSAVRPGDRAGDRGDEGLAPLHAHERVDVRLHAGPPGRRAVPQRRVRVGRAAGLDLAGVCDRLAELPLLFQPGREWNYGDQHGRAGHGRRGCQRECRSPSSCSSDVLDPLGMTETTWWVQRGPGRSAGRAVRADHPRPARRCGTTPMGNWAL